MYKIQYPPQLLLFELLKCDADAEHPAGEADDAGDDDDDHELLAMLPVL